MAYRIHAHEGLPEAIRRTAREQVERAELALREEAKDDPAKAIHAARKAIKKERALLRLVRGPLPASTRRDLSRRLREVGSSLSGSRDAEVMVRTLHALAERYSGQLPASSFAHARERLEAAGKRTSADTDDVYRRQLTELAAIHERIEGMPLRGEGWGVVGPGVLWSYSRARKTFAAARRSPSTNALHQWRKRTKDLWYHLRLLAPACGELTAGQAKQASLLADQLGEDHDLAVLRERLIDLESDLVESSALIALVDHRRGQLQSDAVFTGKQLFAEKPGAFSRRMRRSWKAGRSRARLEEHRHPSELGDLVRA